MNLKRLMREGAIIGDGMCGAGGATTGILRWIRRHNIPVKRFVAINHNPKAIEVHKQNHPDVYHFCKNLDLVNLREAFPEGYADMCWFSPSCTQHSRARGGAPINDQERSGPSEILELVTQIYVERLAIENVPEFVKYGPIDSKRRPIKEKEGALFRAWIASMEAAGYTIEWRIENAADFGAATTRPRFIALMQRTGKPRWTRPTYSKTGEPTLFEGEMKKWRAVRDHLKLWLPCKWVLKRKIPLAAPTLARGWYSMPKIWGTAGARAYAPDVRDACLEGIAYCKRSIEHAQKKLQAKPRAGAKRLNKKQRERIRKHIARLEIAIPRYQALHADVVAFLTARPTAGAVGNVEPFVLTLRGTSDSATRSSSSAIGEPATGITAAAHHLLTVPQLEAIVFGNRAHNVPKPESETAGGITTATGGGLFLVAPGAKEIVLSQHPANEAPPSNQPEPRTLAKNMAAPKLEPILLGQHGGGIARSAGEPANSLATDGAASLFSPECDTYAMPPQIIETNHGAELRPAINTGQPLPAMTGKNGFAILEGFIIPAGSAGTVKTYGEPFVSPTTTQRGHRIMVPYLEAIEENNLLRDESIPPDVAERLLIGDDGKLYLARLQSRMLHPQLELASIMGFPDDYVWPKSPVLTTMLVGNACSVDWVDSKMEGFLGDWVPAMSEASVA